MRKYGFLMGGLAVLAMSIVMTEDLHGQPKGGGGGGGGGGGNVLTLVNNKDVKKELNITDEQAAKIPAEVMAALGKVLDEKQVKRLKQLQLQQQGNNAFKDAAVQKQLNLTAEQKTNIDGILETSAKELAEFKGGFGGFGKGKGGAGGAKDNLEKADKVRKEAADKIANVLTKDQRTQWREMTGEEFKFTTGFGGGNFGKKKDPNKDK
jgi:hypothetical protein